MDWNAFWAGFNDFMVVWGKPINIVIIKFI